MYDQFGCAWINHKQARVPKANHLLYESESVLLQALVEHYSGAGQPDVVERAVLHMDVASLDLNQVPHTCFTRTSCLSSGLLTLVVS